MASPSQQQAFENALQDARMAILKSITEGVEDVTNPSMLKDFAEAYAWVVQPARAH